MCHNILRPSKVAKEWHNIPLHEQLFQLIKIENVEVTIQLRMRRSLENMLGLVKSVTELVIGCQRLTNVGEC